MARRFGRINSLEAWEIMEIDRKKVLASARQFSGVVMFPTTHDLTPEVLPVALTVLRNLLAAGNQVLIVSKPHRAVIRTICRECNDWKKQIQFRFTIGSSSAAVCKLWEPGAPPPRERIEALRYAFGAGYRTSVSMEPMLGDNAEMMALVNRVAPFVTDSVWLGKMNGVIPQYAQKLPGLKASLQQIHEWQSDERILELYSALQANRQVRWKDSIKEVLGHYKIEVNQ
jgi:DNA repair photolyase